MPTANIILYFNDEDYPKYVKQKETLNKKARELIYREVKE
jgi:hypothetical protein